VPADKKPRTAMKMVVTGPEERIVGLHVIGLGADEMLQVQGTLRRSHVGDS
jgi:glutathione reductase (NADPH)